MLKAFENLQPGSFRGSPKLSTLLLILFLFPTAPIASSLISVPLVSSSSTSMNSEKLKQLQAQVRIGGKGTARRKKKVVHRTATTDDKKLQSSLKKLSVRLIKGYLKKVGHLSRRQ